MAIIPQPPAPSDADLMRAVAEGDMQALAQLVRRHQEPVRAVAFRMLHRWDLADDVAQETFLRLVRSARHYQASAGFRTYLFRIVSNLCIDRCRRPKLAELSLEQGDEGPGPEEGLERSERIEAIRRAISKLPDRQRLALVLHRFEGMSHAEIAASTGWSESAIESLLARAYGELRQRLATWSTA